MYGSGKYIMSHEYYKLLNSLYKFLYGVVIGLIATIAYELFRKNEKLDNSIASIINPKNEKFEELKKLLRED